MKKEIGGYFELEQLVSNEYYKDLISINTARNALLYILKAKKIKKLYIPYYLCDSISNLLEKQNIPYEYYSINENLCPIFDKILDNNSYIYIVNYFGHLDNKKIVSFKKKYKHIIIDNTQAFFQKPADNVDTIYSCRKFFGVPDGAYLKTNILLKENIPIDKSSERFKHLLGRYENSANLFYDDFKSNDEKFNYEELKYMSKLTHNIMGAIDYRNVINRRIENYNYLKEKLDSINKLKMPKPFVPFCYPLYIENGDKIRKKLVNEKIFIPVLWPNVLNFDIKIENDMALNILPIPCDQRYNVDDMKYLVNLIKKLGE